MPILSPAPDAGRTTPALERANVQHCACPGCGTDEFLVPEDITTCRLPGRADTTGWDVSYWCSSCGENAGHITDTLPPAWTS